MLHEPQYFNSYEIARDTFLLSGAEPGEIKLQAWGQITNKKHSSEHLKEIFLTVTMGLGLENVQPEIQIEKDAFISISLLKTGEGQEFQLALQSVSETPDTGTSYLAFLLTTQNMEKACEFYYLILPLLREIGYTDELGITISGVISGDLSTARQIGLIQQMVLGSKAEYVEGISGDLISFAFYTPQLRNHLIVNDKKINLQLALRDYPNEKIKIYVGVPMIFQDY